MLPCYKVDKFFRKGPKSVWQNNKGTKPSLKFSVRTNEQIAAETNQKENTNFSFNSDKGISVPIRIVHLNTNTEFYKLEKIA